MKKFSSIVLVVFLILSLFMKKNVSASSSQASTSETTPYTFDYKTAKLTKTSTVNGYSLVYSFNGNATGTIVKTNARTIAIAPVANNMERIGQIVVGKYVKNGFLVLKQSNLGNSKTSMTIASGQTCFYWYLEGKGTPVKQEFMFNWVSLFENRCLTPEGIYAIPIEGYDTTGWFLTPSLHWDWAVLNGVYGGTNVWLNKDAGWAFYYYPQFVSLIYVPLLAKEGVLYTQPSSSFLKDLYGFGGGFYDTRFNTDCADFLTEIGQSVGEPADLWAARKYKAYLINHAAHYFWKINNDSFGILVSDYSWKGKPTTITHASLNHNLQEVNFLLRLGDDDGLLLAQKILKGISLSGDKWIASNGDLNYGYYGKGDYHGQDYKELTLNDLRITRTLLSNYSWSDSYMNAIENLIAAKEKFFHQS